MSVSPENGQESEGAPVPAAREGRRRRVRLRRIAMWTVVVVVGLLAVAQAVPYGRSHDNPPVLAEPQWDSPRTRELAVRACFDCHSNETTWPWYSNVAPVSWLVQSDVDEGRDRLNFSEWNRPQEGSEAAEIVQEGEMPPFQYKILHGSARLSDREKAELVAGLRATFGG